MVTTLAMIVAGVNLATTETTAVNHRFSLDGQLPLTMMRSGWSLLKFFKCYAHMILITLLSWRNLLLAIQVSWHQMSLSTNCMCGYTILLPGMPLTQVSYNPPTMYAYTQLAYNSYQINLLQLYSGNVRQGALVNHQRFAKLNHLNYKLVAIMYWSI